MVRRRTLLDIVNEFRPDLTPFAERYKQIHQYPELSLQEEKTSELAAKHLESAGFEVFKNIGGHSAVGILRNGQGKTVLLRADMDALPILEETDLPYASKVRMTDVLDGEEKPVMHACGHDMHVAMLMAAASCLSSSRKHWTGTLICLFQPAEEGGNGAASMIADGLYEKVPKPDVLFGQHLGVLRAGMIALRPGPAMTASGSWNVRIFGKGGHGSRPHLAVDPIILAAHILVRLQSIISREVPPGEVAVLTCGSIHGGNKDNIIPDYVDMILNLRTYEPEVRTKCLTAMRRVIESECEASATPFPPVIEEVESLPSVVNDSKATEELKYSFTKAFGNKVQHMEKDMASEDFPILAVDQIPYVYWRLGCIDHDTWDDHESRNDIDSIPGNHTSRFAPAIQPTLRRGCEALSIAALTYLGKIVNASHP